MNEKLLKSAERKEQLLLTALTIPALISVTLIIVIPVGWLFSLSFLGKSGDFSLENYQKMIVYKSYFRVGIFMITVLLPFWTSLLVRTYAWLVLLQKKGMINNFAIDMGIWETPIKLAHNLNGTLVGMIHIMLPFMVLPLYAAMQRIDRQTMQAASNLGATPIQAFWQIFVPLSLPGVAAGSLIVFILCLGFYVTPAVLGGGKVIMVSMQITAILEDQFNWGAASALGVVLLVTTFIFLLLASRFLKLDSIMFGKH